MTARNPFRIGTLFDASGNPIGERSEDDKTAEVERGKPGELRFDGVTAGLFDRTASGDRSDLTNYTLFCPVCGAALGVAARWAPDSNGMRGVRCMATGPDGMTCDHVTCLDKDMRIVRVARGSDWDAFVTRREAMKAAPKRADRDDY